MTAVTTTKELKRFVKSIQKDTKITTEKLTYFKIFSNRLFLNKAIRKGVTLRLFNEIKHNSPFDDTQWAEYLDISTKTLSRYNSTAKHVFKPSQSERIFELTEVIATGRKVFDTEEDFMIYLDTPSKALGFERPNDLISTSYGKELILDELHSIEHGIFA